ncbi:MAG: neutral zinc metallopeptidase [Proteiniphilum sp.]|jgi:predicted metalloprotease|uniref:KPN_02809 family neutral zinc metallopeptidase n=1 Tax=Proteiniphilum sp. TaxID=1926877 RepID=UPI00092C3DE1|nr:neutral zinc metallopeptidase [Proteiniphilum sp.]MEA5127192.1 neutral zinc metallopeptidase [Proteiniphilum sp.]OJV86297.1 MAG: metalloprotease [Bacteroidia bacterium 44-10]
MKWINRNDSQANYEDRRGKGRRNAAVGGVGAIIVAVIALLLGQNPFQAIDMVSSMAPGGDSEVVDPSRTNENEDLKVLTLGVFNSANDVWAEIFRSQLNKQYVPPTLVTFTDATVTECGGATAAVGPFYCPADQKMYIDLNFFHQLKSDFGAEGDLAMAYVTAHEVGHHVQKLLGIIDQVNQYRGRISEAEYNKMNVKLELQADFLAGVWVYHAQRMNMIRLEPGDLESVISATTAVGDDTIQKRSRGYTVPDSFTHGTAAQRTYWFRKGMQSGDISQGDTFSDPGLK